MLRNYSDFGPREQPRGLPKGFFKIKRNNLVQTGLKLLDKSH